MVFLIKLIHPLIFAIYPAVFIFQNNIESLHLYDITRSIIVLLAIVVIVLTTSFLLTRNMDKCLIFSSCFVLFFIYIGYLSALRYRINLDALYYNILILLSISILIFFLYFVMRNKDWVYRVNIFLAVSSVFLIVLPIFNIIKYEITRIKQESLLTAAYREEIKHNKIDNIQTLPDIYYIVFDGYARQDTLKKIYDFDNSQFISQLRDKGFYVATNSYSNYAQTLLSVASTLNMDYIPRFLSGADQAHTDRKMLKQLIKNSSVSSFLKQHGYSIVSFDSGYTGTNMKNSDSYLAPFFSLNEFESHLTRYTPLAFIISNKAFFKSHINRILYTINNLSVLHKLNDCFFVFAHIISPHPPFVFDKDGVYEIEDIDERFCFCDGSHYHYLDPVRQKLYISKYKNQIYYLNNKILKMLNKIINESDRPFIIILQSDHGPGAFLDWDSMENTLLKERHAILNAIYFSEDVDLSYYNDISPVNTFRVFFNTLFNKNLPLLEDRIFFSEWNAPFNFYDITERLFSDKLGDSHDRIH